MLSPRQQRHVLVVGWDAEAARALDALCTVGFHGSLIASRSAAELVAARADTALPCSMQATQALTNGPYDLALLADATRAADDAAHAARRGAPVALLPDALGAEDLCAIGAIARAHGTPLFVLRPALHDPGVADLLTLAASPAWRPRLIDITVEGATDVARLGGSAAALIVRLVDRTAETVATTSHHGRLAASTITVGDCVVAARLRHAPHAFVRITGDAEAGAFDLRIEDGVGRLAVTPAHGAPWTRALPAADGWQAEATRVAAGLADDPVLVCREAGLLASLLDTPLVEAPRPAPPLTLLRGEGHASHRRADLRLL